MILEENLESRGYPGNDFELPDNWTVTELGKVLQSVSSGFACGRNQQVSSGLVHLRPMNISPEGKIDLADRRFVPEDAGEQRLQTGDVLFNNTNSVVWVGKTALAEREHHGMAYSNHMTRLRFASVVESRFAARQIDWLRQTSYFALHCNKHVNQASISGDFLRNNVPMLVPPLAEQKRISDKLEAVLGRVDACRARLDRVPDLLKRFRQSVLAAATSGQLTEDWTGRGDVPWKSIRFSDLLADEDGAIRRGPFGSAIKKSFFVPDGYKVYEQKNAIQDDPNLGSYYINEEKFLELKGFAVRGGDFIVSCAGTIGRISHLPKTAKPGVINQALMRLRINKATVVPKYFMLVFRSPAFQSKILEQTQGSAMQNMAAVKVIKEVPLHWPTLEEQNEIVRRVEALFAFADRIEARLTEARAQVEGLTPATLAKAFRGELVPQDPNDEPANALLERLLAARKTEAAQPKPGRAPQKRIMKTSTRESVIGAIRSMNKDKFSFSELRENVQGNYEALTKAVFHLLAAEKPILKQVFNTKTKIMQFERTKA